jgi:hypothetical protein
MSEEYPICGVEQLRRNVLVTQEPCDGIKKLFLFGVQRYPGKLLPSHYVHIPIYAYMWLKDYGVRRFGI